MEGNAPRSLWHLGLCGLPPFQGLNKRKATDNSKHSSDNIESVVHSVIPKFPSYSVKGENDLIVEAKGDIKGFACYSKGNLLRVTGVFHLFFSYLSRVV